MTDPQASLLRLLEFEGSIEQASHERGPVTLALRVTSVPKNRLKLVVADSVLHHRTDSKGRSS